MKRLVTSPKWPLAGVLLVLITILSVQCTKVGTNASQVSRNLVTQPDSAIFSPFYDSTKAQYGDVNADVNDVIVAKSVSTIIKSNCVSASCHGGNVQPTLDSYAKIKAMVVPGNPAASRLYQLITTSDLKTAMPPISFGVDLSTTEKAIIYNWINNGAKEFPDVQDFRPAAVAIITSGCSSGNCHNQATATGGWAKSGYLAPLAATDTISFIYTNPNTSAQTYYTQLKDPKLSQIWQAYKDSVRKFYTDTVAYASYRPWKYFSTRGPLNKYDDIMLDVFYPKSVRSSANAYAVSGTKVNCKGDYLNATSSLLSRVDSSILLANPRTKVWAVNNQGGMAYVDGGLKSSEVALIKAWYFADSNIPDVWKFGTDGSGIFKYRKSGNIIVKK
ncbi:MAG: hypothetical protein J0I09_00330 [Sphingobacteriia bacterium]|nr:hypothetical protein [Sphingobacteriia bacterium]